MHDSLLQSNAPAVKKKNAFDLKIIADKKEEFVSKPSILFNANIL